MERGVNPEVRAFPTLLEASQALAHDLVLQGHAAIRDRGRFVLVLTGGRTCRDLYRLLASDHRRALDWNKVEFFWGDERAVPPDHPESNYRMARELLLDPLEVPSAHIHRIQGELLPPERAAESYAREIEEVLGSAAPRFDLVLLGMGADGHTASLYPRTAALRERKALTVGLAEPLGLPPMARISLTLTALESSRALAFVVAGEEKSAAFWGAFTAPREGTPDFPPSLLTPAGTKTWYVDRQVLTGPPHVPPGE